MRCCLPVSLVLYGVPCYTPSFPSGSAVWTVVACVCAAARGDRALPTPRRTPRAVFSARVPVVHMLAAGVSLGGKTTIANVYKAWRKGL